MKKILYLSFILISNIYANCIDYNQSQCNDNVNCQWIEDIEIGQCSQFDNFENSCTDYIGECFWDEDITYASCDYPNSGMCNSVEGCYWDCYFGYCDCYGQQQFVDTECLGQFEIDNSYCEEILPPECSDLDQITCNHPLYGEGCEWHEDIDYGDCSNYSNGTDCNANNECNWECSQWGSWYSWICYGYYYCDGGVYELDNSSCQETEYMIGDLNQDNLINIQDIIVVINFILYGQFEILADVNYDNAVDVLDIIQLVNMILD